MNRRQKRYRYKDRIFFSMLLIAVLPMMILGVYSYRTYVTELSEKTNLTMETTVLQVRNRVENILDSIKQYYGEVENKEEIKWLAGDSGIDYSQYTRIKKAVDVLSGPVYLRDYINGYIFINFEENWVVSRTGMFPFDQLKNPEEIQAIIDMAAETPGQCFWVNRMDQEQAGTLTSSKMVQLSRYVMALRLPMLSERKSLLLINLNDNKLISLIDENLGNMDITVLDTEGQLVFGSNPRISSYCADNFDFLKNKGLETVQAKLLDGTRHRMAVSSATTNGLIYIASYDEATIQRGAAQILSFAIVLLIAVSLILIIARLGTKIIYTPVSQITSLLNHMLGDKESPVDEFTYIENGLNQLVENQQNLERMVENQKEMLVELFISRLIRGELDQKGIELNLERFNLERKNVYGILCLGSVLEKSGNTEEKEWMELDAVAITITENVPDDIRRLLYVKPIMRNHIIFLMLAENTEDLLAKRIVDVHKAMEEYVKEQYGCILHAGVSRFFNKLKNLRTAYNESIEALKNNRSLELLENLPGGGQKESDTGISYYADFAENAQTKYSYDLLREQEIRKAVDSCDVEKAGEIVDNFVDNLTKKGIFGQDRYFFLHRFLVAIMLVATDAGLSMNQTFGQDEVNMFLNLDQIVEPDRIKEFYRKEIIGPVIRDLSQFRRSHTVDIMEQVVALVKERNGDITATECAQQLNYHPSYIWRVLKAERNMTFTDFVALEKLEIAKEMLTQTELSVADIAARLNYTNTQNFIRFFSKHEGTTPGKYRQEHVNKDK